ncbi:MAG: DNA topoisomerase [Lachnospiraceae bacterium]|nr:DNA topoisomerase [Lachnospiraceae bacterium]
MSKKVFIAEKPSVAREFAKALKEQMRQGNGYMESEHYVVTWCVGHLVTMSYPEAYDPKYKRWSLDTLPFIPQTYRYEVIDGVKGQFQIVSGILNRKDVDTIYVCTDSGREGEYIYRLVAQTANVQGKEQKRVWIDSQTEEEILRGIREAKDLSAYDDLAQAAYLRAIEDYLMGINFSRVLTLKYGDSVKRYLGTQKGVISVGRVMTCVLGMVVNREREIRSFQKTSFYRLMDQFEIGGQILEGEWKAVEGSKYFQSPALYKENGFKEEQTANAFAAELLSQANGQVTLLNVEKKKENKNPPLLYNLAELQNDCSRFFKISPADTLKIVQELYEKKLVTYPRTDARVLSTAVAKEITRNLNGLRNYVHGREYAEQILNAKAYQNLSRTRYVDDKKITDHYAIIPTGQGLGALNSVNATAQKVYEVIVRRFLAIFYPAAVYQKIALTTAIGAEQFFSNFKTLVDEGYLKVMKYSFFKEREQNLPAQGGSAQAISEQGGAQAISGQKGPAQTLSGQKESAQLLSGQGAEEPNGELADAACDASLLQQLQKLRKGQTLPLQDIVIKTGETSPPKRYNSGSMILAMENAGQLIEDEELRAQIKGSGIGTSATRAEILNKLVKNEYLNLNKKTQILSPTQLGELIYDVVDCSMKRMLEPTLTASWEKGLTGVAEGTISYDEYMTKLTGFVARYTINARQLNNQGQVYEKFKAAEPYYRDNKGTKGAKSTKSAKL